MLGVRLVSRSSLLFANDGMATLAARCLSTSLHALSAESTMDLIDEESHSGISSTLQYRVNADIDVAATREPSCDPYYSQKLMTVSAIRPQRFSHVDAHEMDLIQAREYRDYFDKILLLVNHGEHSPDSHLSERGIGQALSLTRRTSAFCNDETGLLPEIVVAAPLRSSIQTALIALPYYSPYSVRAIPWVCSSLVAPSAVESNTLGTLKEEFPGIDYSLCLDIPSSASREEELLEHAEVFLRWIHGRSERIILVSAEATWLQALGCVASYKKTPQTFSDGELRAVGIRFL